MVGRPCCRGGVYIDRHIGPEHYAKVAACRCNADEIVEYVVEHTFRIAGVRLAITATRRANADEPVTSGDLRVWHLGRQVYDTAVGAFQSEFCQTPVA